MSILRNSKRLGWQDKGYPMQRLTITLTQISQNCVVLTPEQHHYLTRVLRLKAGDRFIAMDGQGQSWLAELEPSVEQAALLEPVLTSNELPIPIVLLVAMPKAGGMDDIVRQATELGATEIVPVMSDRTLLRPSPQKQGRWQQIAQEAAEQSERQIVPKVHSPQMLMEALKSWSAAATTQYLCAERGDRIPLLHTLQHQLAQGPVHQIVLATGPEGGWTTAEVEGAIAQGYQPVSLGSRILRAVTAPTVALSLIAAVTEQPINHLTLDK